MKLFTATQLRDWDAYTISQEPVSSVALMKRAATLCAARIAEKATIWQSSSIKIFCGLGNNGGDGLVIAGYLAGLNYAVEVYIVETAGKRSVDFVWYETELRKNPQVKLTRIEAATLLPVLSSADIVIDALFGTGLSKPVEGLNATVIEHINRHSAFTIAVDVPSGLPCEVFDVEDFQNKIILEADLTLTFQVPKLSFFHAEAYRYTGHFEVIDIGLHPEFTQTAQSPFYYIDEALVKSVLKARDKFSHKGAYGHACVVGGSFGKMGAVVLASEAALRAGCGLLTAYIPKCGYTILQTALPEAMVQCDDELTELRSFPDTQKFSALAIGPGMGTHEYTVKALSDFLIRVRQPVVIDADALNACSELLKQDSGFRFPDNSLLTPHPKEFDRLAGNSSNSFERLHKQAAFSAKHNVTVLLKGAHTCITTPNGLHYFNSSGNPLLATGGSGDVLSGILCSLLAQGYPVMESAIAGVYLHGLCADRIATKGKSTLLAGDIIKELPEAIHSITSFKKVD